MAKVKKQDKTQEASSKKQPASVLWYRNGKQAGLLLAVLILTFICFSPILGSQKEFINFDDPVYITSQELITKLDAKHVAQIFTRPDVSLNYHPLTVLSLAVNYSFSKLHPTGYFLTNLLFHVLNTFLVFIFLYRLSGRKFLIGLIAALLFGIHPMHVESVAWAAERKDVLYCFFFLSSCIVYLDYMETKKLKFLGFSFILFLCSCLSKAMAVPLPLVLMLIDYYKQRKFTLKTCTEKIPFFVVSLVIGYIAIKVQSKAAISDLTEVSLTERFFYASYGFIMYFKKLLLPLDLSVFYPYPSKSDGNIPLIYKVAPVITLLLAAVPLYISYKKDKSAFRLFLFGIGFFILMVALVLQFLSVGAAIMADRYSYLPYIGLFFIIATYVAGLLERQKTKLVTAASVCVVALLLAATCYARVTVWQNDEILWTDVITKYPLTVRTEGNVVNATIMEGISIAYENRANYYRLHGEMEKAFADYGVVTRFHSKSEGAFNNMGNLYSIKAEDAIAKGRQDTAAVMYKDAVEMYSEAIKLKPAYPDALHNRAITYSALGEHKKALDDFTAAYALNTGETALLANIGNEKIQLGMFAEGIADFDSGLAASPNDAMLLFFRGTAYINTGKYKEGINDLNLAVKINPALGNAWYNLSFAYSKVNNREDALNAAINAKKNGFAVSDQYIYNLKQGIN